MMTSPHAAAWVDQADLALGKITDKLARPGPGQWEFAMTNGVALRGSALLDDTWFLLDARAGDEAHPTPTGVHDEWDLLARHGGLPAGTKYALAPTGGLHVRAETPLGQDVTSSRILETCEGFRYAVKLLGNGAMAEYPDGAPARTDAQADEEVLAEVRQLCREAGWAAAERASERLAIDLEVPGVFCQAVVEPWRCGVRLAVELEEGRPATTACRKAVGRLLLALNATVRMVRAATSGQDGDALTELEVVFASPPTAAEITHALAALSVACRRCVREVAALADERIARLYLAAWDVQT